MLLYNKGEEPFEKDAVIWDKDEKLFAFIKEEISKKKRRGNIISQHIEIDDNKLKVTLTNDNGATYQDFFKF